MGYMQLSSKVILTESKVRGKHNRQQFDVCSTSLCSHSGRLDRLFVGSHQGLFWCSRFVSAQRMSIVFRSLNLS